MSPNWTGRLLQIRVASLLTVVVLTALALMQMSKLQVDNSNEIFFTSGDPVMERLDNFKATFGNDDFVFILVDVEDAFDPDTLKRAGQLADRLELEVPHLLAMTWIGNVEWIEGVPGGIVIEELIPDLTVSAEKLRALGQRATNDPAYRDRLISGDARSIGLLLEFENYPELDIDPRKDSPPVIHSLLAEFNDLETHVVGGPILDYQMDHYTAEEAPIWAGAALLGMCLLLILTTRSIAGVLIPAATVVLSVIWTMGLVATLGFKVNLFVIMVPTLLLCVGIGDTMHVVAEFQQSLRAGMNRAEALKHTLGLVSKPILLTTVTTAVGFLAFLTTDLQPLRDIGVQAAIGVWIALLLTFMFAVPVMSYGPQPSRTTGGKVHTPDIFDRILAALAGWGIHHKMRIAVAFSILIVLALVGINKLVIETNTLQDLPEDNPMRLSYDYVDERMGGAMSIEFVVDTGKADGIKDIELLHKLDRLQQFLDSHPLVTQTSSLLDQLKQMHRAVHENDPDAYKLPERTSQAAEYLLLYESGGGTQLEKYASFTYDQLRVQARTKTLALTEIRELQGPVNEFVTREFGDRVQIYSTGTLPTFEHIATLIAQGQGRSFLMAFFAVSIVMMLTLGSIKLGLISMIPNVIPVAFALGAMGWFGWNLNMVGLVLAPMIIGVAVDDTVHFFMRYRRYFRELGDYDAAYRETMRTVGRPLMFTTLVLVVGFSGFLLSIFNGPIHFALASMLAFLSALAAEFLLVPVLLSWLKPLSNREQGRAEEATNTVSP